MKLVIMTGGKGVRLLPLTQDIPKPMIEIDGKPVLEHLILLGKKYGVTDIILCNGFLHNIIEHYFGDGSKWGVNITHSNEKIALGTAGALKNIEHLLDDTFLVFQGDVMSELNITKFVEFHKSKSGEISLVVHPSDHPWDSDVIVVNDKDQVVDILHKPGKDAEYDNLTNAGAFVVEPSFLKHIEKDKFALIERDIIIPKLKYISAYAYNTDDYLKDMGTPDRLEKVKEYVEKYLQ